MGGKNSGRKSNSTINSLKVKKDIINRIKDIYTSAKKSDYEKLPLGTELEEQMEEEKKNPPPKQDQPPPQKEEPRNKADDPPPREEPPPRNEQRVDLIVVLVNGAITMWCKIFFKTDPTPHLITVSESDFLDDIKPEAAPMKRSWWMYYLSLGTLVGYRMIILFFGFKMPAMEPEPDTTERGEYQEPEDFDKKGRRKKRYYI